MRLAKSVKIYRIAPDESKENGLKTKSAGR